LGHRALLTHDWVMLTQERLAAIESLVLARVHYEPNWPSGVQLWRRSGRFRQKKRAVSGFGRGDVCEY
jgi:hypothetical protein